jgi:peptidoglycan/LPS O-acetylase OafA/YrhL
LPLTLILLVKFNAMKRGYLLLLFLLLSGIFIKLYCWNTHVLPFIGQNDFYLNWFKWIYYPTFCRLDGLLMGVSIAALFEFKPTIKAWLQKFGNYLLVLSILVLTGAYFLCSNIVSYNTTLFGFPLVAFGYGLMVIGAISPTSVLYKFNSRVTATIATLSYGIYLTHKIIIHITQENFSAISINRDSNWMFFICIITSVFGAFALNKIIEQPFLKVRNRILLSKKTSFSNKENNILN